MHTHTYIHTYTHTHTYIHTYTHTHTYIHTHTHTHTHTYIHTHTHIYTYIHTFYIRFTYIRALAHTHTHTESMPLLYDESDMDVIAAPESQDYLLREGWTLAIDRSCGVRGVCVSTSNNNYYSRPVNYNRIGEIHCGLRVRVCGRG
jgi:hypothetical protein